MLSYIAHGISPCWQHKGRIDIMKKKSQKAVVAMSAVFGIQAVASPVAAIYAKEPQPESQQDEIREEDEQIVKEQNSTTSESENNHVTNIEKTEEEIKADNRITVQEELSEPVDVQDKQNNTNKTLAVEAIAVNGQFDQNEIPQVGAPRPETILIDEKSFPDANFRKIVLKKFGVNFPKVSDFAKVETLDLNDKKISNLKGIEYFTGLKKLNCGNNILTSVDFSKNKKLETLYIFNNKLNTLDLSKNVNLNWVDANQNTLTSIYIGSQKLAKLEVDDNQLTSLNVSNFPKLDFLSVNDNDLKSLNLTKNPLLTEVSAYENENLIIQFGSCNYLEKLNIDYTKTNSLDTSKFKNMIDLSCRETNIKSLNTKNMPKLESLDCSLNDIQSLDLSNSKKLISLDCNDTKLTSLDVSKAKELLYLSCYRCELHSLNLNNCPELTDLSCSYNHLKNIDLSNNKKLNILSLNGNELKSINLSKNTNLTEISLTRNLLKSLDISKNTKTKILHVEDNPILAIDLSKNKNLEYFTDDTIYIKDISTDYTFDLTKYSSMINSSKIKKLTGAHLQGKKLVDIGDQSITYSYDTGNSKFPLLVKMDIQVPNSWIQPLKIDDVPVWEESTPFSKPKYGTVEYTYGKTKETATDEFFPHEPGTWYVKAEVKATENYSGLIAYEAFQVKDNKKRGEIEKFELEDWTYKKPFGWTIESSTNDKSKPAFSFRAENEMIYHTGLPEKVGTYYVKVTLPENDEYFAVSAEKKITIRQADGYGSVKMENWIYGQKPHNPIAMSETNDSTKAEFLYKKKSQSDYYYKKQLPTDAGEYVVKAIFPASTNYSKFETTTDFVIEKAEGSGAVHMADWSWNEKPNAPVPVSSTNGVDHVTYEYKKQNASDTTYTKEIPTTRGNYTVKATFAATNNYKEVVAYADFKIKNALGTASVHMNDWTYGETACKPQVESTNGIDHVTYFYKLKGALDNTYTTIKPSDAGTYVIKAVFAETEDYTEISAMDEFTIHKAKGSGIVELKGWTYKQNPNTAIVKSDTNGITNVQYFYKKKDASDDAYTQNIPVNAGAYTIKAVFGATKNYEAFSTTYDFMIEKAMGDAKVTLNDWALNEIAQQPIPVSISNGIEHVTYEYKQADASDDTYTAIVPQKVGEYVVRATFAATENYKTIYATDTFKIKNKKGTASVVMEDWIYGKTPSEPKLDSTNGMENVTCWYKLKVASDDTYTKIKPTDAGTYVIKAVFAETEDYIEISAMDEFTIHKAKGSGIVELKGWTYKQNPNTAIVKSDTNGINNVQYFYKPKAASDGTYNQNIPVNAGAYTIKAVFGATKNYEAFSTTYDFMIEKAMGDASVKLDNWSCNEEPKQPVVVSNSNGVNHVTFEYKQVGADDSTYTTIVPKERGNYVIRATFAATNNYKEIVASDTFTIEKAKGEASVILDDWTYGETANEPKVSSSNGIDSVKYFYKQKGEPDSAYDSKKPTQAGTYIIKAEFAESDTYAKIAAVNEFSIHKANGNGYVLMVDWTYGGIFTKPIASSSTNGNDHITYYYKLKNASDSTYKKLDPKDLNAGAYTIKAVFEETKNYKEVEKTCNFIVYKANGYGSLTMDDWAYGNMAKTPIVTSETNGIAHVSYQYKSINENDDQYTTEVPVIPGQYIVKATFASNVNYKAFSKTATFTITKGTRNLQVSLDDWTYGEEAKAPKTNADEDAVFYYKQKGADDNTYTTVLPKTAGEYIVKTVIEENSNYFEASDIKTFTIHKAIPAYDTNLKVQMQLNNASCTLKDVALPLGYTWMNDTPILTEAGTYVFKAKYTPQDTANYQVIEGIDVQVIVEQIKDDAKDEVEKPMEEEEDDSSIVKDEQKNDTSDTTDEKEEPKVIEKVTITHGSIQGDTIKKPSKNNDIIKDTSKHAGIGLWTSIMGVTAAMGLALLKHKAKHQR